MQPDRWERVQELTLAALELPPEGRTEYLQRECGGDPSLLAEVARLVEAHPRVGEFLEKPPWEQLGEALTTSSEAPSAGRLEAGDRVGRYVLAEKLGEGGMGAVYAARDPELDRRVAIKLLRPGSYSPQRLVREAQVLARVSHPNVVTVHDAGRHAGSVFLAMELVPGGTIEEWLAEAPREPRQIVDAFLQAGRGLAAAHEAGVVHRDFKPGNLLRSADGTVHVADFGLARSDPHDTREPANESAEETREPTPALHELASRRSTAAWMGTPSYMAPERYSDASERSAEVGPWTDQFAFCVALWEALYGEHPFAADTPGQMRRRILAGEVRPAPQETNVPRRLRQALLRGLSAEPERRWGSMRELIAELESAARRRHRGLIATAVVALIGLAAAVALTGWRTQSSPTPRSIAVVPFTDLGSESDLAYLSQGFTDELITALRRTEDLRVPAFTSVATLRERGLDAAQIGRHLEVAHVLEGSLRPQGDRLLVTVRMDEVETGRTLWDQQFDRPLAELPALQEDVAHWIVRRLGSQTPRGDPLIAHGTDNLEAYSFYLKGREQWNLRTAESLPRAVALFEHSLEADPEYALAYSGLADAYTVMPVYMAEPDPDSLDKALEAAQRAVELAPERAETHSSLALVWFGMGELERAEGELLRAVALDPSYPTAHQWLGLVLSHLHRTRDAVAELETARELDPASSVILAALGGAYFRLGQHDKALEVELALRDLDPSWGGGGACITRNYIALGRYDDAVAAVESMPPESRSPACWLGLAEAHHLAGDFAAELTAARSGQEIQPIAEDLLLIAETSALAALGRFDELRDLVLRELDRGTGSVAWLGLYAVLGELRVHGHRPQAEELAAEVLERHRDLLSASPQPLGPAMGLSAALLESGREEEGAELLANRLQAIEPTRRRQLGLGDYETAGLLGWLAALEGDRDEAGEALDQLAELESPANGVPYPAFITGALGDTQAAADDLRRRLEAGLVVGRDLHLHLGLEPLRGEPAYRELAAARQPALPLSSPERRSPSR